MKSRSKLFAGAMLLVVTGATIGPVVIAAVGAWIDAERQADPWARSEVNRLVEAYRQRLPPNHLFLSLALPEDGKECGYDSTDVFPNAWDEIGESIRSQTFNDYAGYYALDRWRNTSRDEEWISAITASIAEETSEFEASFLRRCIEATLFSDICIQRVAEFGDSNRIPRFDHDRPISPPQGIGVEDEIVCTYVDGVAARRNLPLANWKFD